MKEFFRQNKLMVPTVILFAAAAYFTMEVESARRALKTDNTRQFISGETVRIIKIIDGDEVVVRNPAGKEGVVRMLGIQGFRVTVTNSMQSFYGRQCVEYLKKNALNKDAVLTLGETSVDRRGRALGYLELDIRDNRVDLGKHLVSEGLVVVYTKYDFERMSTYLQVEQGAMTRQSGLWQNDEMRIGVNALKETWAAQKDD